MLDIKELIRLLPPHHLRPPQLPVNATNWKREWNNLFIGVSDGAYTSDAQAASLLFAGNPDPQGAFKALKTAFRDALIQEIGLLNANLEHSSDPATAYSHCQQQWLSLRSMTGENAHSVAPALARQLLQIARRFDFTRLCMDIALFLRVQYCLHDHQEDRCREADQQHRHFRLIHELEHDAEKSYAVLQALITDTHPGHPAVGRQARAALERIGPAMRKYPTFHLQLYGHLIALHWCTDARDFRAALRVCDKAIRYFNGRPYMANTALQVFYYQQLLGCVYLKNRKKGQAAAGACLSLAQEGDFNWYKIKELQFVLLVHTRDYRAAAALWSEMVTSPHFGFLPDYASNAWYLYRPFLQILDGVYPADAPRAQAPGEALRALPADLPWQGVAQIVAHWFRLLQQGEHTVLTQFSGELNAYCNQHLRGASTRRSFVFFQMLLQLPLHRFDRAVVTQKTKRLAAQLAAAPMQLANQTQELEIIPYEDLWNIALNALPG